MDNNTVKNNIINHNLDQYWVDCRVATPPKGVSLICLTRYGITQIGPAHGLVVAWMPKPGKPEWFNDVVEELDKEY